MKRAAMEALPPVGGEANPDPNLIRLASDDFGHILRKPPSVVLKPSSAAEIAAAVGWAGRQGLEVAPRGQGHSTGFAGSPAYASPGRREHDARPPAHGAFLGAGVNPAG
jgi:FAD binding domain